MELGIYGRNSSVFNSPTFVLKRTMFHYIQNVCMYVLVCKRFVQKLSGLTTVHEVDKPYGVLTLIVFNIVPFRSYTLRPSLLPLLETFCELLFRDV